MLFPGGSRFPCSSSAMIDCGRTIDENPNHSTESADQKKSRRGIFVIPCRSLLSYSVTTAPLKGAFPDRAKIIREK
jgi:hypothetical protein